MARSNSLPIYSAGSIGISGGVVTGVGTNWLSPDGIGNWTIAAGDIFVTAAGVSPIRTVTDATHLTLEYWPAGTIATGTAYKIYRLSGVPNNVINGVMDQLLAMGSDTTPDLARVIDGGTTRLRIKNAGDGSGVLQTRLSSASDAAYVDAIKWASDGTMTLPSRQLHGLLAGTSSTDAVNLSQITQMRSGIITPTTDANGYFTFVYPTAFATQTDSVIVMNGDVQSRPDMLVDHCLTSNPGPAGYFTGCCRVRSTGAGIASATVVLNYIATGR